MNIIKKIPTEEVHDFSKFFESPKSGKVEITKNQNFTPKRIFSIKVVIVIALFVILLTALIVSILNQRKLTKFEKPVGKVLPTRNKLIPNK